MLTCVPAPYPRLHRSSVLSAQALVMVASGRPDSAWPFQTPVGRGPALAMERALSRWEAGAVLTHGSGCRTPALSRRFPGAGSSAGRTGAEALAGRVQCLRASQPTQQETVMNRPWSFI